VELSLLEKLSENEVARWLTKIGFGFGEATFSSAVESTGALVQ